MVRSGESKALAPGADEEVGRAWTSLCHDGSWSGSRSRPVGAARQVGLMCPHRAPRGSGRLPCADEYFPPPGELWPQQHASDGHRSVVR